MSWRSSDTPICRAPQHPRDPPGADPPRPGRFATHGHQPPGPLRRTQGAGHSRPKRLGPLLREQRRVILAIDGLQPHVGHEVLWVLRDCLSGEILLARSLLSSTAKDLAGLITEVPQELPVPIAG